MPPRAPFGDKADIDALVHQYLRTKDPALLDRVARLMMPHLRAAARRRWVVDNDTIEDLVMEGQIAVMRGINRFDPERGVRFTTYAVDIAVGKMRHYMRDKHGTIRVPAWFSEWITTYRTAFKRLTLSMGRLPSDAEVAEEMGTDEATVRSRVEKWGRLTPVNDSPQGEDSPCNQDGTPYTNGGERSGLVGEWELEEILRVCTLGVESIMETYNVPFQQARRIKQLAERVKTKHQ